MSKPTPQLGWLVHYVLGRKAVQAITSRRAYSGARGTEPQTGQVCAAFVVGYHPTSTEEEPLLNLRVLLDGEDDYWAEAVWEGLEDETDTWRWAGNTVRAAIPSAIHAARFHDHEVMQAATDAYYAEHPELDRNVPRSLEYVVEHPVNFADDQPPVVRVIGHQEMHELPGWTGGN